MVRSVVGLQGLTAGDPGDGLSGEVSVGPNVVQGGLPQRAHRCRRSRRRLRRRTARSRAYRQHKRTKQEVSITSHDTTGSEHDIHVPITDVETNYSYDLKEWLELALGH